MKVLALVLLCALAVQGRNTGVKNGKWTEVGRGQTPYLVHLRVSALNTNGFLRTCLGSLIAPRWILTSASCAQNALFIWARFAAPIVYQPEYVLEVRQAGQHIFLHEDNIALIRLDRDVEPSDNIAVTKIGEDVDSDDLPEEGTFCYYGEDDNDAPGTSLGCSVLSLDFDDEVLKAKVEGEDRVTEFDVGGPLVVNGEQIGLFVERRRHLLFEDELIFLYVSEYRDWIEETADIKLSESSSSESSSSESSSSKSSSSEEDED